MTGLELIRRIVGLAKVKDITCIENEEARARAERICLQVAKSFILRANQYRTGTSFVETLKNSQCTTRVRENMMEEQLIPIQ